MVSAERPASDEPHVEFEDIGKSYDGRVMAVRGFNLSVRRGEFLSLLGPSGSGKTTCLMMLAGFETPTTGAIRISGRSNWSGWRGLKRVGQVNSPAGSSNVSPSPGRSCSNPTWY